jgi:hypothetical protein
MLSLTVGVEPEGSRFLTSGGVASGQYVEELGMGPQSLEHALVIGASQIGHRNVQAGQLVLRKIVILINLLGDCLLWKLRQCR